MGGMRGWGYGGSADFKKNFVDLFVDLQKMLSIFRALPKH